MRATYRSFAKVNLHLEVLGLRSDGYHQLRTVFQSVDLCDFLTVEIGGQGLELEVTGGSLPSDARNLAYRAAESFLAAWPEAKGVRLILDKRIPVGGGLGGGSSNAAVVLLGLRELLAVEQATDARLEQLGRDLGADVPFFLHGGTALGLGRGDEIVPLSDLPAREVWLATPGVEVSTKAVFAEFKGLTENREVSSMGRLAWEEGADWETVARSWNDLQPLVLSRLPEASGVYNALTEAGAGVVRLSGSGATWWALFEEPIRSVELESRLPSSCRVCRVRTLSRRDFERLRVVD
jgi:4-diphosphocytidyl-2-C-methyl-D-erythritol kinase